MDGKPRFFVENRAFAKENRLLMPKPPQKEGHAVKRILSACLNQTLSFETQRDYRIYLDGLERKQIPFQILEKTARGDGSLLVRMKRAYNNYPVGSYLEQFRKKGGEP